MSTFGKRENELEPAPVTRVEQREASEIFNTSRTRVRRFGYFGMIDWILEELDYTRLCYNGLAP
jgi:hypothetical protein